VNEQFVADRDKALLSLNRATILAYLRKYDPAAAKRQAKVSKEVFWGGVHKARTAATSLPMTARTSSKVWLAMRGLRSEDDGDVPWGIEVEVIAAPSSPPEEP
jgi:hypothetical protein